MRWRKSKKLTVPLHIFKYFLFRDKSSDKHTQIGLPSHYVNASFNFIRRHVRNFLISKNRDDLIDSFEKIIDLNLDFITTNFQKSEQVQSFHMIEVIDNAIKKGGITPYLQPIVDSKTKQIIKYEALVRLIDQDGKLHNPFEFLDIAKRLNRYCDLSRSMITRTIEYLKNKNVNFSVNLTSDDITNKETLDYIMNFLNDFDTCENITFEIVETEDGDDFSKIIEFCEDVHKYGAKIAIDDFGTGFSNYDRVLSLKPDFIKIDGSLIKNLHTEDDFKHIVEAIVNWAKKLNIQTVAEFIHCQEVSDIVEGLDIDLMQGYHYGQPEDMLDVEFS